MKNKIEEAHAGTLAVMECCLSKIIRACNNEERLLVLQEVRQIIENHLKEKER